MKLLILHKPTNRRGLATDIINSKTVSVTFDNGDVENILISEIKLNKMKKIKEEREETMFIRTKSGSEKAVKTTQKAAQNLKKDPDITDIDTARGKQIKEQDAVQHTTEELKNVAREVGKALALALEEIGDEVVSAKIISTEEDPQGGSFDLGLVYKDDNRDEFSFYISGKDLHLTDFTFDKVIGEVGILPSGEPIVQRDILKDNLVKHFRSLYLENKNMMAKTKDGQDIFVGDTLYIAGKKFNVLENKETNSVELVFEYSGKRVRPKDPTFSKILRNSLKEDNQYLQNVDLVSVGHVDDEPDMLKKYVYDIVVYGAKLYKDLCKYDNMNAHVDFPNWWQSTIIKARENMSKAQHYLEFEDHEEPIDSIVGSMIKEKK